MKEEQKKSDSRTSKKPRNRLAYIQKAEDERVFIDIIQYSKKGTSYIYKGKIYNRKWPLGTTGHSTDGEVIRVYSLSKDWAPEFKNSSVFVLTKNALPRFKKWLKGEVVWD